MADWTAIRAAIAAKAAGVSGMAEGTSTELSGVVVTPCVKVTHVATLKMTDRGMGYEKREATISGHLLVAKTADVGRALESVETHAEALTVAFRTGVKLGYPTLVSDSWLDSWEAGSFDYAGQDYAGASLTFIVRVHEEITRTA